MGKVIPFQRPRPRRPGPAKPRQGAGEKGCWAWWLVGAAAAAVAAILSPLLWPARILLILLGGVGIVGAVACYWLSSPTNWPMIRLTVVAFLGSVTLWHCGEAALKGARTLNAYSFEKVRQLRAAQRKAA
ncbi:MULTISPECIES: hypothetical protein [Xanthomonas]|uniref:Uncharacterized protein n=2 Tax=Xanthomonas arboricola pv. pruni TaxID=69929 RepID=W4SDP7_9XANT|nr:hypothetical protein [Xanthomonas campestris]MEB2060099.1 hypothetical protein [Xanthomonas campestris pv. campestris]GAE48879.1 hypothetical protein XPU_0411 [Xanthomonas arboricola pv. pruni str. MAFF 311562]GAE54725.1 hypothetical protein XPR_1360 [Xanthomonas arboricola pv. pruni MAFF 301420]GAE58851.1 hypothetical protein XPN_0757 [Xanthomonas arboricola pv. pruni MAFF 301427]MCC5045708.1 hypothetical protein [Xanthomonas campestris]